MAGTLKISPSHVERSLENKPHLLRYATQLKKIDKDGNGELDLEEVCEVLDEMANIERQRRLLKWVAIISGIFALLSIAAIVGLTYTVVHYQKETKVGNDGALYSTGGSSSLVSTGSALTAYYTEDLYQLSASQLSKLNTIVVPDDDGISQTIVHVAELKLVPNVSVTITSPVGTAYTIDASGISTATATAGRRLLGNGKGKGSSYFMYAACGCKKSMSVEECAIMCQ